MMEMVLRTGSPNSQRRACEDCRFMRAAVSWWCTSAEAKAARGTSIPGGVSDCPFWAPCRTVADLGFWERHGLTDSTILVDPV